LVERGKSLLRFCEVVKQCELGEAFLDLFERLYGRRAPLLGLARNDVDPAILLVESCGRLS
jgi:hypothetical protein